MTTQRLRTAAFSLLAILLFLWFLRGASIADVWEQIRRARVGPIVAAFVVVALTYVVRALRWQCLLRPVGPTRFGTALSSTVIGFAASFVLPARPGEVLRPYLLARKERLSATSAFATIVVERVLDLIVVLLLLAVFLLDPRGSTATPAALSTVALAGLAAAVVGLAAAVLMWLVASRTEAVAGAVERGSVWFSARWGLRLSVAARTFSKGLAVWREPIDLAAAFGWSIVLWLAIAGHTWLVMSSFSIVAPFTGAFLVQALLVIGVALPTPGAVGGYHEAFRIGSATFFGAGNDAAVGAAIVSHALSFVPVTLVGLGLIVKEGLGVWSPLGISRIGEPAREEGAGS